METLLKPYDKEYMKMAMLKHEETFKQQVYELHRLYRVQKILMKSMGNSWQNGQNQNRWEWDSKNAVCWNQIDHHHHGKQKKPDQQTFDLEIPANEQEYIGESGGNGMLENEDESGIELTLGLKSFCRGEIKAETPLTSDSGLSFSSSSLGSKHSKRTNTRSTQQRTEKKGEELQGWHHSGRRDSFDVDEQLRQDGLKQHSWFFQALSLKMA